MKASLVVRFVLYAIVIGPCLLVLCGCQSIREAEGPGAKKKAGWLSQLFPADSDQVFFDQRSQDIQRRLYGKSRQVRFD